MARLHDVTTGKFDQFKRVLADADFDSKLVDLVVRNPELARKWVTDLREQLNPPAPTFDQLFQTPEQIRQAFIARVKQRGWGFSIAQCNALYDARPVGFVSTLTGMLSLRVKHGRGLEYDAQESWAWVYDIHGADGSYKWDSVHFDKQHLRPLKGTSYSDELSVEWDVIDITANRDKAPSDVRDANSAGLELINAAALHPAWPKAINYDTIPGVNVGAFEVTVPGRDTWQSVLFLDWDRDYRTVDLHARWAGHADPRYSGPVVRE